MLDAHQAPLFADVNGTKVAGLTYVSEALSLAVEHSLVDKIAALDFEPFAFRGFLANRRTISFGWRYDFNGGGFKRADAMPAFLEGLRDLASAHANIDPAALVQAGD